MSDRSASPLRARPFAARHAQAFVPPPGAHPASPFPLSRAEIARREVPLDELSFFHLKSPSDIAEIQHLRSKIRLPASAVATPGFRAQEKKETRKASSGHSNGAIRSSAP